MNRDDHDDHAGLGSHTDRRRRVLTALAAPGLAGLAGLLLPAVARAHGNKAHAGPKAPAAAKAATAEQKDWGIAGRVAAARRTVDVRMGDDMRFKPDRLEVAPGETLRIRVRNDGRMLHEFVIGTREENARHAELMLRFPDMEHDEPYMAHVPPGQTAEIVWTFNRPGEFEFACLIAGHYQAGMRGTILVRAR